MILSTGGLRGWPAVRRGMRDQPSLSPLVVTRRSSVWVGRKNRRLTTDDRRLALCTSAVGPAPVRIVRVAVVTLLPRLLHAVPAARRRTYHCALHVDSAGETLRAGCAVAGDGGGAAPIEVAERSSATAAGDTRSEHRMERGDPGARQRDPTVLFGWRERLRGDAIQRRPLCPRREAQCLLDGARDGGQTVAGLSIGRHRVRIAQHRT